MEAGGAAQFFCIVGEGILGFGNADGQFILAQLFNFLNGFFCRGGVGYTGGAVNGLGNFQDFLFNRQLYAVNWGKMIFLFTGFYHLFRQLPAAFAAFGKYFSQGEFHIVGLAVIGKDFNFFLGVGGKFVNSYNHRHTILFHVFHMGLQVAQARL